MRNVIEVKIYDKLNFFNCDYIINEMIKLVKNYNKKNFVLGKKEKRILKSKEQLNKSKKKEKTIIYNMLKTNKVSIRKFKRITTRKPIKIEEDWYEYSIDLIRYTEIIDSIISYLKLLNGQYVLDEIHNKLVKNKWPNVNKSKSNLFCHIRRNELDSLNYSYKSKLPNGFSEYINKKIVLLINKLKVYDAH